ncbi:MAG: NAD(P)/FAD-dependent oxidoreductase [Bradymonadaceae bacterium]|nr:NAD(P)/FAD-dependent oxidoreductase [Lujinxingiaceae bacterium]
MGRQQIKRERVGPYEVAIVGAGPAGLSAGQWLARFLHDVVLIDSGDPRNWATQGIHGMLGHANIRPAELRRRGREECRSYGVELIDDHVDHARRRQELDLFELKTRDGRTIEAKRVLIAIGVQDNWPSIPGLERCYGTTVHTCPHCDGYEARDSPTAVLGSGPKAASVAIALAVWTRELFICTHGERPHFGDPLSERLEMLGIRVITEPILFLEARLRYLHHIDFESGRNLACEHIFIAMGQHPPDDIGEQLGCHREDVGLITIDEHHQTSVPHVFAAGDITPGLQLASRAACHGVEAAIAIHRSLIPPNMQAH